MVYQRASSAGKVILLEHCDSETSLCEAGCCRYSADTGAWKNAGSVLESILVGL